MVWPKKDWTIVESHLLEWTVYCQYWAFTASSEVVQPADPQAGHVAGERAFVLLDRPLPTGTRLGDVRSMTTCGGMPLFEMEILVGRGVAVGTRQPEAARPLPSKGRLSATASRRRGVAVVSVLRVHVAGDRLAGRDEQLADLSKPLLIMRYGQEPPTCAEACSEMVG
jgi:hypothetical protein